MTDGIIPHLEHLGTKNLSKVVLAIIENDNSKNPLNEVRVETPGGKVCLYEIGNEGYKKSYNK
jgi:hypothetical protein